MRFLSLLFLSALLAVSGAQAQPTGGTLKGVLTDDSGAIIPGASVSIEGNGSRRSVLTQNDGSYLFPGLAPGQYSVTATFPGFKAAAQSVSIDGRSTVQLPIQMTISTDRQEVTVAAEAGPAVSVEPDSNATALVLKDEDLAALPDDPDDLADALQALAGPGAGPDGGSIYIDGFSGGELPPKESIREVRINQNPFSAEFDRLGFGRIEVLTRPGSDRYRGSFFLNDSEAQFNSRNPFSTNKPDFSSRFFGGNLGGPINKRASFFLAFNRRQINDNALVNAVYLDPNTLAETSLQQAVVTPNTRTTIGPRLDYQLSTNHTLVGRFEYGWNARENSGIGGYRLPPPYADMGYDQTGNFQNLMLTETAVLNSRAVNETRFQFTRNWNESNGNLTPQIAVTGAFTAGGNNRGLNSSRNVQYELQNNTSLSRGSHTIRFGVRLRRYSQATLSEQGFGGSFFFDGGLAPVLDANNQPIPGTEEQIEGIEQYRRTLLFQRLGYSLDAIRALGGGPTQFSIQAGNPYGSIVRWDLAPFLQDDWRIKPNFTLSLGIRYEAQTLLGGAGDIAPRVGFAWAPGHAGRGRQKTVIRGGVGVFLNRIGLNTFLNTQLLNGFNQENFIVASPNFFPAIPSLSGLTPAQNSLYRTDPSLRAAYSMQGAIGIERQLPRNSTVAVTYTHTRGLHLLQTVPINTPLPGTYVFGDPASGVRPYGDAGNLFQYQSGGLMRQHLMMVSFNTRLTPRVSLQGNYTLNYMRDLPGTPTNPYNFAQDWGRSNFDRRNRFNLFGSVSAPFRLMFNPFLVLQSGAPYDVVIGRDVYGNTLRNVRPSFASGPAAGISPLDPAFYNADPDPNSPPIPRNYLESAGMISLNVRVSRTFGFGAARGSGRGSADMGRGGPGGGRGPGGFGGPGGGMRMGPMGGGGMFGGGSSEHRFNLTFSMMVSNILNHTNDGGFVGNLNSPQFGQPTLVYTGFGGFGGGGTTANNRRVELQTRFTF